MRDYAKIIDLHTEGFGMSKSFRSRSFEDRIEEKVNEFEFWDLARLQVIALFHDGQYLSTRSLIVWG